MVFSEFKLSNSHAGHIEIREDGLVYIWVGDSHDPTKSRLGCLVRANPTTSAILLPGANLETAEQASSSAQRLSRRYQRPVMFACNPITTSPDPTISAHFTLERELCNLLDGMLRNSV